MKKTLLVVLMIILSNFLFASDWSDGAPGPGYKSLFNGKDFTGWNIEPDSGRWIIQDGIIKCLGKPSVPYVIKTLESYSNFDFYADFKIAKGHNSGILFHVPMSGRESRLGFEIQIHNSNPDLLHTTGSIYDVSPAMAIAEKPAGEWNRYHIRFEWPMCTVWLNDVMVQEYNFESDMYTKFRLRTGPIGLQNHGDPVEFKNIWVKRLPAPPVTEIQLFNGKDLSNWVQYGYAEWDVVDNMIVGSGGDGWLVTDKDYEDFYFQAYVENDLENPRKGAFYVRWNESYDPGYRIDFYDHPGTMALVNSVPKDKAWDVGPYWPYPWTFYQIISSSRYLEAKVVGMSVYKQTYTQMVRPGKIAIFHSKQDGILRIQNVILRPLY